MLDKEIVSYYNTDSDIHRLNPIIKILSLFLFFILFLIVNNYLFSIVMLLFSMIFLVISKVPYKLYVIRTIPIVILCIIILIINLISNSNSINFIIKLLSLSIYYSVYIYSTRLADTNKGIYDILRFLDINDSRILSFLLIVIHFIQIIYIEYLNTLKIQVNRNSRETYFYKTIIYSFRRVKNSIAKINNTFKIKEYNFRFKHKKESLLDYSILGAHLMLFFVYFLGKI